MSAKNTKSAVRARDTRSSSIDSDDWVQHLDNTSQLAWNEPVMADEDIWEEEYMHSTPKTVNHPNPGPGPLVRTDDEENRPVRRSYKGGPLLAASKQRDREAATALLDIQKSKKAKKAKAPPTKKPKVDEVVNLVTDSSDAEYTPRRKATPLSQRATQVLPSSDEEPSGLSEDEMDGESLTSETRSMDDSPTSQDLRFVSPSNLRCNNPSYVSDSSESSADESDVDDMPTTTTTRPARPVGSPTRQRSFANKPGVKRNRQILQQAQVDKRFDMDARKRNFVCTHYVHTPAQREKFATTWTDLEHKKVQYAIAGLEKCPTTGREHRQIFIRFKDQHRLPNIIKLMNNMHCEIAIGSVEENRIYCSKILETDANGDVLIYGNPPMTQAEKGKHGHKGADVWKHTRKCAEAGTLELVTDKMLLTQFQGICGIERRFGPQPDANVWKFNLCLWGEAGTGKSLDAQALFKQLFMDGSPEAWLKTNSRWVAESTKFPDFCIWEEFNPDNSYIEVVKSLASNALGQFEFKGGLKNYNSQLVLTSNHNIVDCVKENDKAAIRRRFIIVRYGEIQPDWVRGVQYDMTPDELPRYHPYYAKKHGLDPNLLMSSAYEGGKERVDGSDPNPETWDYDRPMSIPSRFWKPEVLPRGVLKQGH